jgi:hypothetical protein
MAATVTIRRTTGAGPTVSAARTAIRSSTSDSDYTTETTNPIPIPGAGTNYGYWVSTRLSCDVAPAGTINNLRWYSDGSNNYGTGITCKGQEATGYVQATGTPGTTGTQLTTGNYATLTGAPVDVFGLTTGSPKSLAGSTTGTGNFGSYFVYQHEVASTAGPGTLSGETFTWKWDET